MKRRICAVAAGALFCLCLTGCGPSAAQQAVYGDDGEIARQSHTYFIVRRVAG